MNLAVGEKENTYLGGVHQSIIERKAFTDALVMKRRGKEITKSGKILSTD